MKTTVKGARLTSSQVCGHAKVCRDETGFIAVEVGEGYRCTVLLDKSSAYVLGNALIGLAQTIEAEEGGYELCGRVSNRVACTFRKGTKCPDCGPVLC